MRLLLSGLYVAATFVSFLSSTASAAAIPGSDDEAHLSKRAPPYPEDPEIRAAFIKTGPMVFYSNLPSGAARLAPRKFAALPEIKGHTAKTAFGKQANGKDFTDMRDFPAPAPDADTQGQLYNDFAARFSRIMAQEAEGPTAFVVLVAETGPSGPKANSIWTQVELPALKLNANIKNIVRVSPTDFNDRSTIFTRPGTPPPASPKPASPKPATPKRDEESSGIEEREEHVLVVEMSQSLQERDELELVAEPLPLEERDSEVEEASTDLAARAAAKPKPAPAKAPTPAAAPKPKPTSKTAPANTAGGSSNAGKPTKPPVPTPTSNAKPTTKPSSSVKPAKSSTTKGPPKPATTPLLKFALDWNDPPHGPPPA